MPDPLPAGAAEALQPVHEPSGDQPADGVGLCLSGGGYRAMLFHLGALQQLNETGELRTLDRISSVSGGSITAATLGLHWESLEWKDGVAQNLREEVVEPVCALAGHTIDVSSVLEGFLPFTSVGERVADAYREHLFGDHTLQDLPADGEGPRFVICATNVETGVLLRFSRPYIADYRVGTIRDPQVALADAVAASSAFPPVLSPFKLDFRGADWETVDGNDLAGDEHFRGRISLSDGGVYDNLGLETVWKRCRTVLISDGGGHFQEDSDPPSDWAEHSIRVAKIADSQVRALRKRQAVASYELGLRHGAYWGIRPEDPASPGRALAEVPTRLKSVDRELQDRLIAWGYDCCKAAARS
jgi:NTE family protein